LNRTHLKSGLEIARPVEIRNERGLCGVPSELCLRLCARSRTVDSDEVGKPAEMAGGLDGGLADDGYFQAPSNHLSDVVKRHALIGDPVKPRSARTLFKREPEKMRRIEPVHRGPAVDPVTHIRRNTRVARDADESGKEAVIAVAMHPRAAT